MIRSIGTGCLHVGLDLVDRGGLVGRLPVRERVLELALPRRVRPERVAGRRRARRVEADEFAGDLPNRLARTAFRLLPVRAAEAVQWRGLAADVPGQLVERIGRDVDPVPRHVLARRRVFEDEVLPRRTGDGPLHHLHVPADAVHLVDDRIPGAQGERVDDVTAPRRQFRAARGVLRPEDLGLGEQRKAGHDEAVFETAGRRRDDGGFRQAGR